MSDIFKEAMEEVAAEARNEEQQQTVSFIHAPEILGHHLHVSTGNSSHDKSLFDSSEASELWAEPAIPPSHLEDESNGGHTADESESGDTVGEETNNSVQVKWAETAIPPSYLERESEVQWAEAAIPPSYLERESEAPSWNNSWTAPATPMQLSVTKNMKALTISPISSDAQELAWDPD